MNAQKLLFFLFLSCSIWACQPEEKKEEIAKAPKPFEIPQVYDSLLARNYGADEYGMKKYVMAFLKRGENRSLDSAKSAELQMAHLQNIQKMAKDGKLILAGPFFGDGDLRGIYIFNVSTIAEAEELTNTDPAIQAGSLKMELKEWYGSAALVGVNDLHSVVAKKGIME